MNPTKKQIQKAANTIRKVIHKPSREPQKISDCDWYYENKGSIEILHEIYIEGQYLRTDTIKIPKKMLIATLKRINP